MKFIMSEMEDDDFKSFTDDTEEPIIETSKEKPSENKEKNLDQSNVTNDIMKIAKPNQRLRFDPKKNITIFGPTQSGKTHFVWRLFTDGWIPNGGEAPFDVGIYVGNSEPGKTMSDAIATMGYTYSNINPSNTNKQAFVFSKANINELEPLLKSNDKKKVVVIDDTIMANDNKTNNLIASLMQQGQHFNSTFIAISHNASGSSVKNIRDASNYFVFCNSQINDIKTATKITLSHDSLNKAFINFKNMKNAFDKIIIWDGQQFYDKNLYPLLD